MNWLLMQSAPATEAADAVWRLESSWRYAPWLTVLAVAGFVLLVVYCYARELSPAGRAYRWLLGGLRVATIVLLMVMLSELLLAGSRSGRPRFVMLIDQSASMGVADPTSAAGLPESVRSAIGLDDESLVKRIDLARAALSAKDSNLLTRLSDEYELEVFAFAEEPSPLAPGENGWESAINAVEVDDSAPATRLGDAVEGLVSGSAGRPPQGVLVVGDGRVTAGRPLSVAAESARRASTPLYFLGVGSRDEPPDAAIDNLLAEELVFVDDLVSFRAVVKATGSVRGPLRVTLRLEGESAVLAEQTIDAPPGGGATPVQLIDKPEKAGVYRYVVEVKSSSEELNTENNARSHEVAVSDQKVRVLLAASGPSYEFRYLKHLLDRDSTVDLDSFLQEADLEYASADPTALTRLPLRRKELDAYDALVLIDLDPRLVPRSFWPALRGFVGDAGGGLALVAGPRYLPGAYRDQLDFVAIYPADIAGAGVGDSVTGGGFRVAPTPLGLQRAAMQLADDAATTTLAWNRLPPLYWYAEIGPLKPAAQMLAAHPTAAAAGGGPAPLVVTQYFGAGQVVLHAIDSTYRWRRQTGDVYFARYWVQTLRSLARGRLAAGRSGSELTVERRRYEPGETIRLRLRAEAAGEGATVLIEPESGTQRRVQLSPTPDARGVYEATLERLPVGRYRALVTGAAEQAVGTSFEVVAPPGEFTRLEMAADEMQAAAERTRGGFFTIDQLGELSEALPQARRVPIESLPPIELWNQWWMIAAVCGCLTTEWILRKRKAML